MNNEVHASQRKTMKSDVIIDRDQLEHARNLVKHLEAGNRANADKVLAVLTRLHESAMFHSMCKLTQELHSAIDGIQNDSHLVDIAKHKLPDAIDSLNYVIHLTEDAANKTLTAVEEAIPVCEEIEKIANSIKDEWKDYVTEDGIVEEFRLLVQKFTATQENIANESSKIRANLGDVLIAQDFQDRSGQCIHRVISLAQEIEQSLVNFIRRPAHNFEQGSSVLSQEKSRPDGSQVSGKKSVEAMLSQDDVDDLMSSLGI
jgi:chemotaxis protein CheZ